MVEGVERWDGSREALKQEAWIKECGVAMSGRGGNAESVEVRRIIYTSQRCHTGQAIES
jgi:hypothetical protein